MREALSPRFCNGSFGSSSERARCVSEALNSREGGAQPAPRPSSPPARHASFADPGVLCDEVPVSGTGDQPSTETRGAVRSRKGRWCRPEHQRAGSPGMRALKALRGLLARRKGHKASAMTEVPPSPDLELVTAEGPWGGPVYCYRGAEICSTSN